MHVVHAVFTSEAIVEVAAAALLAHLFLFFNGVHVLSTRIVLSARLFEQFPWRG